MRVGVAAVLGVAICGVATLYSPRLRTYKHVTTEEDEVEQGEYEEEDEEEEGGGKLPRNDSVRSVFSVGLNKSESVGNLLNTYGDLCESGQTIIARIRYASWAVVGSFVVFHVAAPFFYRRVKD